MFGLVVCGVNVVNDVFLFGVVGKNCLDVVCCEGVFGLVF